MSSTEHNASSDEYDTPSGSEYSFDEIDSAKCYSDQGNDIYDTDNDVQSDGETSRKYDDDDDEKTGITDKKVDSSDKKDETSDNKDGTMDTEKEDTDNGLPKEIIEYLGKKTPAPKPSSYGHTSLIHRDEDHHYPDDHPRDHHRRILLSRVLMPSGRSCVITIPAQVSTGWRCGFSTRFITLRPNGKMGKREYTIIKKEMEKTRRSHFSGKFSGYEIIKIQKVVNPCLWSKYKDRRCEVILEAGDANERMLFHGSRSLTKILQDGFDERISNPNGMFGAGIYFAQNSSKSNQYVFSHSKGCPTHHDFNCFICERQLLLCRVALGKSCQLSGAQKMAHSPPGYQSVEGIPIPGMSFSPRSLRLTEHVIYRGEQAYPEYLITYKIVK